MQAVLNLNLRQASILVSQNDFKRKETICYVKIKKNIRKRGFLLTGTPVITSGIMDTLMIVIPENFICRCFFFFVCFLFFHVICQVFRTCLADFSLNR